MEPAHSAVLPPPAAVFESRPGEISQAPSRRQLLIDRSFRLTCLVFAYLMLALVTFIVLRIAGSAAPAAQRDGFGVISGRVWDPNTERYGILAEIWGTLFTSLLALIGGSAFGVAAAIFLAEGFLAQAVFGILRRTG